MQTAGQKADKQYLDLQFIVQEFEDELDRRDYSDLCKRTKPIALQHSQCACIGSETTLKQKTIKKLFPDTLKECEILLDVKDQKGLALDDDLFTPKTRTESIMSAFNQDEKVENKIVPLNDYVKK